MSNDRKLIRETSYPSYMTFSFEEMRELVDSFMSIISSIKQSLKLAWSTIELNLKVIQGSWTNNKKMIDEAYNKFQEDRRKYDEKMEENLKYFKKYYVDSRLDTLGGFGPPILAFAANPMLFVAGRQSTSTITRATGSPYDVTKPWSSAFKPSKKDPEASSGSEKTKPPRPSSVTPNVQRALAFFEFEGSRLAEAAESPAVPAEQVKEAQKLQMLAAEYVKSETRNSSQLLEKLSNLNAAMKDLLNAKTFEELVQVMKKIEQTGIKMSTQGIQTASKNIRNDFEKQSKSDPEKFKAAVELMRKKSPDIGDQDPVESAMKFIFGISKTKMQRQLIKSQEELIAAARNALNLPISPDVRTQLQQSDIGKQYLLMVDDFDRKIVSGEREVASAKKSLKTT